jgi:hypothetical protein
MKRSVGFWAAAAVLMAGCGGGEGTATSAPGTGGAASATGAAGPGTGAAAGGTGDADFTKVDPFKRVDSATLKLEGGGKFLPTDPVEGMVVVDAVRYYTPESLSELIDGEAQSYVDYGVKALASTEYAPEGGTNADLRVTAHVYDMGTPQMAFGRYAESKADEYRYLKLGTDGYVSGSTCVFYRGPWLVELSAGAEGPEMEKKLEGLARAIEAKLPPADGAELALLAKLPGDGRKAHSERYAVQNAAEMDGLGAGFWARYDVAGKEARVFARPAGSADAAKKALAELKAVLGGKPEAVPGVGEEALAAKTEYHGEVVLLRKGGTVAGVTELADRVAAVELAKKVAAGL